MRSTIFVEMECAASIFALPTVRETLASSRMATFSSPIDAVFYKAAGEFFREQAGTALTYDDVTLATLYSEILPRDAVLETELHPRRGRCESRSSFPQ